MKSRDDRIKEFVEYHIKGDGECNNTVLKYIADKRHMTFSQRCDLSYFFAITYCVASAILIYDTEKNERAELKHTLIFQSDRKYVAMGDRYEKSIEYYERNLNGKWDDFCRSIEINSKVDLRRAVIAVQKWFYFGRFAAYLFLETFCCLNNLSVINNKIDWKNGDTATSGLLNIYGYDKSADYFDKKGKLPDTIKPSMLDRMFVYLQEKIKEAGGDDNTTKVETSMCAYRKFYKGTRYNGYYLDRMLGELRTFDEKVRQVTDEIYEARSKTYEDGLLGEKSGWKGIRKEMKKYYQMTGEINDVDGTGLKVNGVSL